MTAQRIEEIRRMLCAIPRGKLREAFEELIEVAEDAADEDEDDPISKDEYDELERERDEAQEELEELRGAVDAAYELIEAHRDVEDMGTRAVPHFERCKSRLENNYPALRRAMNGV